MMAYTTIMEGSVTAWVPRAEKISSEMEVFYNPVMRLNRDVTVLVLRALGLMGRMPREGWRIASPLAGSGVRECRLLSELPVEMLDAIRINDISEDAVALIKRNIARNEQRLNCDDIEVSCNEANRFLSEGRGYSYIDIDPFGSPNPFLDTAVKRLRRGGVLGVTATDTSALSGTYPKACERKYWSTPLRNHLMHEVGLRILVRKVQLVAGQYERALTPIYAYSKDHYMRVFFACASGRHRVDEILVQHQYLVYDAARQRLRAAARPTGVWAGPLWTGALWDAQLAARVAEESEDARNERILSTIAEEAKAPVIGFYHLNLVRKLGREPKRKRDLLERRGVWPTHFEGNAVRARSLRSLF